MPLPPNSNLTLPLLIGGSSSVGKSNVARQISEQFQVPCVHLDAYFEQIPDPGLNLFPTHHNPWELSAHELRDQIIQTGQNATPYIHALVDTYEKKGIPVIEGERIIPLLVERLRQFQKAVGIFIIEEAPHRLYETLQNRSKRFLALTETQKWKVVQMDILFGQWLRVEADLRFIPWVSSQPWESLLERIVKRIQVSIDTPYEIRPI